MNGQLKKYSTEDIDKDLFYRPDDEEFHIGFEYYREEPYTGELTKEEVCSNFSFRHYNKYSEEFYAKYLDKEDILDLGFIQSKYPQLEPEAVEYMFSLDFEKDDLELRYNKWIVVGKIYNIFRQVQILKKGITVFKGDIKNKSELKMQLKMLNWKDHGK